MEEEVVQLAPQRVEQDIRRLLDGGGDDRAVLSGMEALSRQWAFGGLTWLWGPVLYRRNRAMFRPFITSHFSETLRQARWKWSPVEWKGAVGQALDGWLAEVDAADDVGLFKRLYQWKVAGGRWARENRRFEDDLCRRFNGVSTPAARATVLAKLDLFYEIGEQTAMLLYREAPGLAKGYVLKHLPRSFWGEDKRTLWQELHALAKSSDPEFADALYRQQVSAKQWATDALDAAKLIRDAQSLCERLDRMHPQGWNLDLSETHVALLRLRGREVLPYVMRHLGSVFASRWGYGKRGGYAELVELAWASGWHDLWAAAIRLCAQPKEYNREVQRCMRMERIPEMRRLELLSSLAGMGEEFYGPGFGFARVQLLDTDVAMEMYQRYPQLVHGVFRSQVAPGWREYRLTLIEAAIRTGDAVLVDRLASRIVMRVVYSHAWAKSQELEKTIDVLADYYSGLKPDDVTFSRRAANVLTQVPAYTVGMQYNELIRTNRLARMLLERSAALYLADAASMRDLVEATEIHVQALAYRAMGLDDERARIAARQTLDILIGTLLRPLHRKTRALAFGALRNAATEPESAARVLAKCREAMDLPDERYPKEQLLELMGWILSRHPELRSAAETPVMYRGRLRKREDGQAA